MSVIAQISNHVLYLANFDLLCTDMFELSQDTALTAASGRAVLLPVEGFLNKYVEKKKKKIEVMRGLFSRYGIPLQIVSDNGPQSAVLSFSIFGRQMV